MNVGDDHDPTTSDAFAAAFGRYVVARMHAGKPLPGIEEFGAYTAAWRACYVWQQEA